MQALENFKAALTASDLKVLQQCLREAKQPVPVHALPWYLGDAPEATGYLVHEHAKLLRSLGQEWTTLPKGLCWDTPEKTPASRNMALAQLAAELRTQGQITGWRDEKFSFWLDEQGSSDQRKEPDPLRAEAFRMERAAFRFFGLRSPHLPLLPGDSQVCEETYLVSGCEYSRSASFQIPLLFRVHRDRYYYLPTKQN